MFHSMGHFPVRNQLYVDIFIPRSCNISDVWGLDQWTYRLWTAILRFPQSQYNVLLWTLPFVLIIDYQSVFKNRFLPLWRDISIDSVIFTVALNRTLFVNCTTESWGKKKRKYFDTVECSSVETAKFKEALIIKQSVTVHFQWSTANRTWCTILHHETSLLCHIFQYNTNSLNNKFRFCLPYPNALQALPSCICCASAVQCLIHYHSVKARPHESGAVKIICVSILYCNTAVQLCPFKGALITGQSSPSWTRQTLHRYFVVLNAGVTLHKAKHSWWCFM